MSSNELTKSEEVLLGLIKQAMFNIPCVFPDDLNWDEVYQEANTQAVLGLVANYVPENAGSRWKTAFASNIGNSIRYLHAQSELIALFNKYDIPLVILKGAAAAVYYPVPMYRSMGDIDFIVSQDCFNKACELMTDNDYLLHNPDKAFTRHRGYSKGKITYELHHHFSYDDLDIEKYIIDALLNPDYGVIDGIEFPMLPKLANGLVLLAHMRNHLQSGLGLRQLIDWMMYVNKELDDSFWRSEFQTASESVGMSTLAITATHLCQMYFGLRKDIMWCRDADESLCNRLLKELFSYGNFGIKHGQGKRFENVSTRINKYGLFNYLQLAGENKWTLYHRHKWLKSLCWIYQIGRLTVKGVKSGRGNMIIQDFKKSNERYDLLKQLNIMK